MKISFFENDKMTAMDELVLFLIVAACLTVGILLIVHKPSFWIIDSGITSSLGVVITLLGVMYIPCLIYRLFTNDK